MIFVVGRAVHDEEKQHRMRDLLASLASSPEFPEFTPLEGASRAGKFANTGTSGIRPVGRPAARPT